MSINGFLPVDPIGSNEFNGLELFVKESAFQSKVSMILFYRIPPSEKRHSAKPPIPVYLIARNPQGQPLLADALPGTTF